MKCSNCHMEIGGWEKTCPHCGAILRFDESGKISCQSCFHKNDVSAHFCVKCGQRLMTEEPVFQPDEREDGLKDIMQYKSRLDTKDILTAQKRQTAQAQQEQWRNKGEESTRAKCPYCGSESLSASNEFNYQAAAFGYGLMGDAGYLAGGLGGSKHVMVTCLKCGYRYRI